MNKIFILGDIHGNTIPVRTLCMQEQVDKSDIVILLGDVGLNYYLNKNDDKIKKNLLHFPCKFYCLRGNHEQRPSLLENFHIVFEAGGIMYQEDRFPNIYYFDDVPEHYIIGKNEVLTIPGAYSVDKFYRLSHGWNWFPQEQLSAEEWSEFINSTFSSRKYDIVLSHTCPYSWMPTDLFLPSIDQSKVDKTMELWLEEFMKQTSYNMWFFGHYHGFRWYQKEHAFMLFNNFYIDLNELIDSTAKGEYPKGIKGIRNE